MSQYQFVIEPHPGSYALLTLWASSLVEALVAFFAITTLCIPEDTYFVDGQVCSLNHTMAQ